MLNYWRGTTHVDVCENVKFLYNDSKEEIKETISEIMQDDVYDKMKKMLSMQVNSLDIVILQKEV